MVIDESEDTSATVTHNITVSEAVDKYSVASKLKKNSKFILILICGMLACFLVTSCLFAFTEVPKRPEITFKYKASISAGYLFLTLTIVLFTWALIQVFAPVIAFSPSLGIYLVGLLRHNGLMFSIFLGVKLVYQIVANSIEKVPVEIKGDDQKIATVEEYQFALPLFFAGFSQAMTVFFFKTLVIFTLNYNVHTSYYADRIKLNYEKIALLQKLSAIARVSYIDTIESTCRKIMSLLTPNTPDEKETNMDNFRTHLSHEDFNQLVGFLDKEAGSVVSYDDLFYFYTSSLYEQNNLAASIIQMSSSVERLDFVATFICSLLAFALFVNELRFDPMGAGQITAIMTGLVTGGYIFSDVIRGFIGSVLFVFFIRPFEAGDFVAFGGNVYEVQQVNILTSVLKQNKLTVIISNSRLVGESITNYRTSHSVRIPYSYTFDIEEFRAKEKQLLDAISQHMKKRPKIFKNGLYYTNSRITSDRSISVDIVVEYSLERMSMEKFVNNQHQLVVDLRDICQNAGLTPFKRN